MCFLWCTNWVFISQKTAFFIVTAVNTSNLTILSARKGLLHQDMLVHPLSLSLAKHNTTKDMGEWIFLTLSLVSSQWSALQPSCSTLGKGPWYPMERTGGLQNLSGWQGWRKFTTLPELKLKTFLHPAHHQTLYQLHYPSYLLVHEPN
jgi:hypothetical protein